MKSEIKHVSNVFPASSLVPQALINMGEILKAAGCDYTNGEISLQSGCSVSFYVVRLLKMKLSDRMNFSVTVVKTTVLLADINDFNNVNEVYKTCESMLFFAFLSDKFADMLYFSHCEQTPRNNQDQPGQQVAIIFVAEV